MTRAEEAALKAYPPKRKEVSMSGCVYTVVGGDFERRIYQQGYEQAEKDLSLTIEDIELLHTFLYAVKNNKQGMFTFTRLSDEQYKEVLRRFKKAKEDRNETI